MKRDNFIKICILCIFVTTLLIGCGTEEKESTASVSVVSERVLVPGGQSVGIKMEVKGVLIVGLEEIETIDGEKINPGILSGLQIGDMILSINDVEVYKAEEVQELVNKYEPPLELKVKRNNEVLNIKINPVISAEDEQYKIGVWVKDKTAGIGTLTYYDPSNATFGALGHGIVDPESGAVLSVDRGLLLEAKVQQIEAGETGNPGEIEGVFYHADNPLGSLKRNSEYGVFGIAYHPMENSIYSKPLPIGYKEDVKPGKAYILSTLSNNKVERFEVKIEKVSKQDKPDDKSMVIKVTDKKLLNESGGIVQGMSGSPIIQNDRIIGAVTHVFVNNPQKGYGIFIEWMLEESNYVDK